MTDNPILQTITPVTHDLGGFKVHRTLPSRPRTMVGPFIFFDQMGPANFPPGEGIDVRPHPHINLSTVTYLFEGSLDHRDSLGTYARIEPGAVNLMTAGRGIVHSERSGPDVRTSGTPMSGIQTWLALPDGKEEIDPAFEHVAKDELPLINSGGTSARVIMGTLWGASSPVTTHAHTIYADIVLGEDSAIPIDASADERALYVVEGAAHIDDMLLDGPTGVSPLFILKPGISFTLRAASYARVILCGGEAFATPRHVWWNFVSSSRDRINQAKEDWRSGRFALVPDDAEEFIPLPEVPLTVSYP